MIGVFLLIIATNTRSLMTSKTLEITTSAALIVNIYNMASLLIFLKREYAGSVHELGTHIYERFRKEVREMSNGLGYMIDDDNQWQVVSDGLYWKVAFFKRSPLTQI